jgi:hypothetical protein
VKRTLPFSTARSRHLALIVLSLICLFFGFILKSTFKGKGASDPTAEAHPELPLRHPDTSPRPSPQPQSPPPSQHKASTPAPSIATQKGAATLQKIRQSATSIRRLYQQVPSLTGEQLATLQDSIDAQCEVLKRLLLDMPEDEATDGILRYLRTNEDTPTSLPFAVDEGGTLAQAPTLRTLLLDVLGRTGPEESVTFANRIFEQSNSPDEWALALRNLGWHDLDDENRPLMLTRFQQMLANKDWVQSPTEGFLESLDISVHLGFEVTSDWVAALVSPRQIDPGANPTTPPPPPDPVTHAATLALHRMAINDPAPMMDRLSHDPDYLQQAAGYRASLIARADIRDPVQANALTAYLTSASVSPQEHRAFLAEFPNRNGILTHALVSTLPPHLEFDQNLAIDRAALALVDQWIQNKPNPALDDALQQTRERLLEHLNAATLATLNPIPYTPSLDRAKVPERAPDNQ